MKPAPFIVNLMSGIAGMAIFTFYPVLLRTNGMSISNIAFVLSFSQIIKMFSTYIFGRGGEFFNRKLIILTGILSAISGAILMGSSNNIYLLIFARLLFSSGIGMIPGSLLSSSFEAGVSISALVAIGSLGWGIGGLMGGALGLSSILFYTAAGMLFIGFLGALKLKVKKVKTEGAFFSFKLFKDKWYIYLPFFLRHAGAFGIWSIFSIYLKSLGASDMIVGIIFAINPFFQALFMIFMDRVNPRKAFGLGLFLSALTFFAYSIIKNYYIIIPVQIILALSWATLYLGAILYLLKNSTEKSTATGNLHAITGLSGIAGPLMAGIIVNLGSIYVFILGAFLSLSAGIISLLNSKKHS